MDKLMQIRVFARVAERGGFSAAGRDLDLSQSAVSKAITALEEGLGSRLVNRSTRAVTLTEAGQTYYRHCRNILDELETAEAAVGVAQSRVGGSLGISAPIPFGLMFVSPRTARFMMLHPDLTIRLDLNDRFVDLAKENIDVAIRLGQTGDAGVGVRKLGESPFLTVASPDYLARRGTPLQPPELLDHDCLIYGSSPGAVEWRFAAGCAEPLRLSGRFRSNNLLAVRDAALAGNGIARLPAWMAGPDIEAGNLRALLPDHPPPSMDIHAVFPSPRRIPAKARLFADFLQDELAALALFPGLRPSLGSHAAIRG
ncbi:MAG: LysR family transcriptional regulator [Ectothiorhodospiraceae bacterium]|nr:LysR family transcriptional regulator [Ectothiorhodospiraceae bacterium]